MSERSLRRYEKWIIGLVSPVLLGFTLTGARQLIAPISNQDVMRGQAEIMDSVKAISTRFGGMDNKLDYLMRYACADTTEVARENRYYHGTTCPTQGAR